MDRSRLVKVAAALLLLLAALPVASSQGAESAEFKGSWIANGTRTTFPFVKGRKVFTFQIGGHVSLQTALRGKKDYWSDCIGLADAVTGMIGRCVWKDLAGPELYVVLQSDRLEPGSQVKGTIVGGTGPLSGLSGELSFNWSSIIVQTDAQGIEELTGQTLNLAGRYRAP
ncbi:MAG TPA: hypothetical protein VJ550_14510 [Geomonas sp.]|nr:hypothetical protein [Geomonas sp.]